MRTTDPAPPRSRPEEVFGRLDWTAAHRAGIQMRYGDLDTMGHLNNAVYVQYLETSRVLLMTDLGVPPSHDRSVIARLELDYRHEIRPGQTVVVETLVERLGRTSWTLLSRVVADGRPCAYARTVQVRVDAELRPVPLADDLRGRLETLLAPELAAAEVRTQTPGRAPGTP